MINRIGKMYPTEGRSVEAPGTPVARVWSASIPTRAAVAPFLLPKRPKSRFLVASCFLLLLGQLEGCGGGGGSNSSAAKAAAEVEGDSAKVLLSSAAATCQTDCTDAFGVQMIYPSKPGGESWSFSSLDDPRVGKWGGVNVSMNDDGSIKARATGSPAKVRINIYTSTWNEDDSALETNQKRLAERGHMFDENDWRNVEMTGFVKLVNGSGNHFTWYTRGARHSTNGCWGTSLKSALSDDGRVRIQKEQHHIGGYVSQPWRSAGTGGLKDKWVGFKAIIYNREVDGRTASVQELYVNDGTAEGAWRKVYEYTDSGGWSGGSHCGGASDQIITWGGPIATLRWDKFSEVHLKNLSVREIDVSAADSVGDGRGAEQPQEPEPSPPAPLPQDPLVCGSLAFPVAAGASQFEALVPPTNAIDGNLFTRWSAYGLPQWIDVDLGEVKPLCSAHISWYRGPDRTVTFDVDTSIDGSSFTNQLLGVRNRGTRELEEYMFTSAVLARFMRIRVTGNTENQWASIKEIRAAHLSAASATPGAPPTSCSLVLAGSSATATGYESPTVPANAVDGNFATRWSAQPVPHAITVDMGASEALCAARVAWYAGSTRKVTFDVDTSDDGVTFTNQLTGVESRGTAQLEEYLLNVPVAARYLRIRVTGNTANSWASISEVQGVGMQ